MVPCLLSREISAAFLNQSCQAVRTNSLFRSWPQSFPCLLWGIFQTMAGEGGLDDLGERQLSDIWTLEEDDLLAR